MLYCKVVLVEKLRKKKKKQLNPKIYTFIYFVVFGIRSTEFICQKYLHKFKTRINYHFYIHFLNRDIFHVSIEDNSHHKELFNYKTK